MPPLTVVGLHKNSLADFPVLCDNTASKSFFPNLVMLYVDFNDITSIQDPICLPKLQFLIIMYNRFNYLATDTFVQRRFAAMTQLWVNKMEGKSVKVSALAFNRSALTCLGLGNNKLHFR